MTIQLSTNARNGRLNAVRAIVGPMHLFIRTGAAPANADAANSGTVLADITMPDPAWNAASGGQMTMTGSWVDLSANASGTAGHWRISNAADTTCYAQGSIGTSGADLVVDSLTFTAGQGFSILSFTLTAGNP